MPSPTPTPTAAGPSRQNRNSASVPYSSSSSTSVPRRRQRVDSDPDLNLDPNNLGSLDRNTTSSTAARSDPKRQRSEAYTPPTTTTTPTTMSAKVQGKRPEIIDLTGGGGSSPTPRAAQPYAQPYRQQRPALQAHLGARKLVVKNLRPTPCPTSPSAPVKSSSPSSSSSPSPVDAYYAAIYAELDAALSAIFAGRPTARPMERLYRGVEDVCRRGRDHARDLTERLRRRCEDWLVNGEGMLGALWREYESAVGTGGGGDNDAARDGLLKGVVERWRRWNEVLFVVRGVYSYLDRSYLGALLHGDGGTGGESGKGGGGARQGINEMGIALFRTAVFGSSKEATVSKQGARVLQAVCGGVAYLRRGDPRADGALVKEAITVLRLCGVYGKYFESMFLVESHRYFEHFAAEMSATYGLKDYIGVVEKLLDNEAARCDTFNFESTTKRQLLDDAHHTLIHRYSAKLLDSGSVARLLDAGDVESMRALYELLKLSGLQKRLKGPFEQYIRETGAGIVSDTTRQDEMVVRLLELRRMLDLMIRDALSKDEVFTYALRESFSHFVNERKNLSSSGTSKVGEMIAKHLDMLLRGGLKTLPKSLLSDNKDKADAEMSGLASTGDEDAELDRQLDHCLELFRFIDGKDVFEAFYKKDLARRILLGRSASQDAERSMLSKLKNECGFSFTHNLEQMFKDQELAKDEMTAYKEWLAGSGRGNGGIDLNVNILSAAAWPTFPDVKVLLPKEVLKQISTFDSYYKRKHTGRRLTWKHNMAHCVIKAQFNRGPKELLVSAPQAAVLMLFNDVEEDDATAATAGVLSYEQISEGTGLKGGELDRTLQSLACGRARVLTKHPKGRDVNPTDTFTVNKAFTDPKYRVKINQIQLRETKEENRETHARVAADRQFETQAAIVRIMKSRKSMTHAQLVAEVINQTKSRGAVDAADIKANIEK
ncbi:hypothetical protein VTK26DRAFT_8899 [Humicola hyalothermophila]